MRNLYFGMVNARVVRRKRRGENSLKKEGWFWRGTGCGEFMTKIWSFEASGGNSGPLYLSRVGGVIRVSILDISSRMAIIKQA